MRTRSYGAGVQLQSEPAAGSYQGDEGQPARGNHDGGAIAFGPDGKLYVIVGDVGRFAVVTDIETAPNGNLIAVSLTQGAVYEIFRP